jgi:ABC-type cobalt transport system substrate-binding protein
MFKKNKWMLLFIVLALLLTFSLFAVPKIAVGAMNEAKGKIVTIMDEYGR